MHDLRFALNNILDRIASAKSRAGRNDSITLVAVSKNQPVDKMNDLRKLVRLADQVVVFGENYLQEFKEKTAILEKPYKAHFIGRLQSNKVRQVVKLFDLIESVDSVDLLKLINTEAEKLGQEKEILLQVNVSSDPNKGGFDPEDLAAVLAETTKLPFIALRGLMTITELYSNPEDARKDFKALRDLRAKMFPEESNIDLSMGMSQDFEIAIEEGATIVRIGTALFGERQ